MRTIVLSSLCILTGSLFADGENAPPKEALKSDNKPFKSFTGLLTKNKVRLRVQPTLEANVIRELSKGDMLIVNGEIDDFYSVLPPQGSKAYIFRTFVLDNTVEGTRVNVRLEPSVDAPIIAQLNTGDRVNGTISPLNSKWLEIPMPATARFYVAKEYIEKIGDANLMAQILKKRDDINQLLSSTLLLSQHELQKPFPDIKLDSITKNYHKIMDQAKEFPEQAARAKELLQTLNNTYVQKKIAYLEAKTQNLEPVTSSFNASNTDTLPSAKKAVTAKMAIWNDAEETAFREWQEHHPAQSMEEFIEDQLATSKTLKGILEPYTKAIKNKPGDYVLVNQSNHGIIAYVYSNRVNLADSVGHEVSIKVAPRPNNNFAFPAYMVLEIEH